MVPMRKRANVEGEERYPVNEELNRSVAKLEEIYEELEKIDSEITRISLELEQNFKIRREVYLRRNEIIKYIPHFWLTMFENHPDLGTLITKQDEEILKYMVSLDVKDFKGVMSGYTITFNFSSNPYFEDTKLTKTYSITNDGTISKTGIPIKWKEGTDSANVSAHERIGAKRPFAEDSFIRWFIAETLTHGATDEVCETIREDIWPDPLKYFREEVYENEFNQNGDDEIAEQDGEEEVTVSDDDDDKDEDDDEEDDEDSEQDDEGGDTEEDNEYVDIEQISDEGGNAKEDDEHVDIERISDGGNSEEDDEYVDIERISDEENGQQAEEEEDNDDDEDDG